MPRRSPRICGAGWLEAANGATLKSRKARSRALLIVICLRPLNLSGDSGADGKSRHCATPNLLRLQGSCILALEETEAGGLADDGGFGSSIVVETSVAGGGVVSLGDTDGGDTPVGIRGEDTASLVDRKVIEVQ